MNYYILNCITVVIKYTIKKLYSYIYIYYIYISKIILTYIIINRLENYIIQKIYIYKAHFLHCFIVLLLKWAIIDIYTLMCKCNDNMKRLIIKYQISSIEK